jgi:hypothetical protein
MRAVGLLYGSTADTMEKVMPAWYAGAEEQRSSTAWDTYLEDLRKLNLCGEPLEVLAPGSSRQPADGKDFCGELVELYTTFARAGKMLNYQLNGSNDDAGDNEAQQERELNSGEFPMLPLGLRMRETEESRADHQGQATEGPGESLPPDQEERSAVSEE